MNGTLSVDYTITNTGSDPAYSVEVTGSTGTNGVTCPTEMPVEIGNLSGGGGSRSITLEYSVPDGTGSFVAIVNATAHDPCGNSYSYPEN